MHEQPPAPVFPDRPPLAPPPPPVPPGAIRPSIPLEPLPPPAPPSRSTAGWIAAGAVLAVLVLLAGTVLAFRAAGGDDETATGVQLEDGPGGRDRPSRTPGDRGDDDDDGEAGNRGDDDGESPTATTQPPATEDELLAVIAEIQAFVEQERGLPFLRDPVVELADDEEFEARLLADFEEDADDIVTTGRVLEAIGLIEPGTDLLATLRDLLAIGVVGFYDPETEELVVRATRPSPYARIVIAHELVHALDDQHFELHRPDLDEADDERGFAFGGLVEGDARHVEEAYRATLSPAEQAEALAEEFAEGVDPAIFDIPIALIEQLQSPYELGPALIALLLEEGGTARVDAAFAAPPTSSEHLLEPDSFLEGDEPITVPAPAADGEVIDQGVLGALGIAQLLGLGPLLNPGEPAAPVAGWGGDAYVAWIDPAGRACLRATIVGDTPGDTAEFATALRDWTDNPPLFSFPVDATVTGGAGGEPITLTSCATT